MNRISPEKQGARLLIRLLIWGVALLCFWYGCKGISSQGIWSRNAIGGPLTIPPEGFLIFGVLLFFLDWVVQRSD
jgi:hypothetical protein